MNPNNQEQIKGLFGLSQISISQIDRMDITIKALLYRNELLQSIEETISKNETLQKYFVSAKSQVKTDDNNAIKEVFRIALTMLANAANELEVRATDDNSSELKAKIYNLEVENASLTSKFKQIMELFEGE